MPHTLCRLLLKTIDDSQQFIAVLSSTAMSEHSHYLPNSFPVTRATPQSQICIEKASSCSILMCLFTLLRQNCCKSSTAREYTTRHDHRPTYRIPVCVQYLLVVHVIFVLLHPFTVLSAIHIRTPASVFFFFSSFFLSARSLLSFFPRFLSSRVMRLSSLSVSAMAGVCLLL